MSLRNKTSRTGGPKTEAGKRASSRNALKIGVYTHQVVLPGENPEQFAELLGLFMDDFQPVGVTEAALVNDLAVLAWKKRRLEGIEHRQLLQHLQAMPSEYEFICAGLPIVKEYEAFFQDPYRVDDCDVPAFREYFAQLRILQAGVKDEATLKSLHSKYPNTYARLAAEMKQMGVKDTAPAALLAVKFTDQSVINPSTPLDQAIQKVIEESRRILWAADHQQDLLEAYARIRDTRLANKIDNERFSRAYEHLARNFYKTLGELRKQQEWRRKQQVIDVTPEAESEKSKIYKTD